MQSGRVNDAPLPPAHVVPGDGRRLTPYPRELVQRGGRLLLSLATYVPQVIERDIRQRVTGTPRHRLTPARPRPSASCCCACGWRVDAWSLPTGCLHHAVGCPAATVSTGPVRRNDWGAAYAGHSSRNGSETAEVALTRQLGRPVVVLVIREGGGWLAEVAALGVVRRARCLVTLDHQMRDLLGTNSVDYQFQTGDAELDRLVMQIRSAKGAAGRYEERARRLTRRALLLPSGGSGRDLAVLLGLSHQRVHQLMRQGLPNAEGEA